MFKMLVFSFIVSLVIGLALGPFVIKELKKFHARQSEREEGPQSHKYKAGTPTMGGRAHPGAGAWCWILSPWTCAKGWLCSWPWAMASSASSTTASRPSSTATWALRQNRNWPASSSWQLSSAISSMPFFIFPTTLWIPFTSITVDLGIFYYLFVFVMIVGPSNAVNLTDGLDGLAAGSCAITSVAYVVIAVALGYSHFAIFGTALTGACLGFLFYNQHPAKMFMGDTGSLALGGALAAMAILTKTELLLILAGGLYVIEALSVIIQVISFKTRGVRVFKMSPIHHHFELSGWSEVKVVTVFWSFSVLMAILSIIVVLACK